MFRCPLAVMKFQKTDFSPSGFVRQRTLSTGWAVAPLAVGVGQVAELLAEQGDCAAALGLVEVGARVAGQDGDRARFAGREILLQLPRALHAHAVGVHLAQHVVTDGTEKPCQAGTASTRKLPTRIRPG